jgi:predicted  nucleic acid-binding Zn-ribbon protein
MTQPLTLEDVTRLADQVREVNATLAASDTEQTEAEARLTRLEQFADRMLTLSTRYGKVRDAQARIETLMRDTAKLDRLVASLRDDIQTLEQRRAELIAERDSAIAQRDQAKGERDGLRDAIKAMKREWREIAQALA